MNLWDAWLTEKKICLFCCCVDSQKSEEAKLKFLERDRKRNQGFVPSAFRSLAKEMTPSDANNVAKDVCAEKDKPRQDKHAAIERAKPRDQDESCR